MFNRPTSPWSEDASAGVTGWELDRNPQNRLFLLWIGMLLPVLAIGGRVAQLQLSLQDDFAGAFSLTNEVLEEIPARDGRILAADGSVLADDAQEFDVAVHYAAIQNPPSDDWIMEKVNPRLSKSERRNKERVAEEKAKVIAETESLWNKLAELTEQSPEELLETRRKQQVRVEKIKELVNLRYRQRHEKDGEKGEEKTAGSTWLAAWQRIQRQMEEPRKRPQGYRLIAEEKAHHTVITNITADMKAEIEAHRERYPDTKVLVRTRRTYPRGQLAAHLIGFRKPISEEQLQERRKLFPNGDPQKYRVGDPCGFGGLEQSYDALLKGVRGQRLLVTNRRGEIIDSRIVEEPKHGRNLVLTIDPEVQQRAEQLLKKALTKISEPSPHDAETNPDSLHEPTCPQGGCIVALDVYTGATIAAASEPGFDLNLLVASDSQAWNEVMSDPRSPMLSRATKMALPPGSVFKAISAVASIESGTMHPDTSFYCQGYLNRPGGGFSCLSYRHQGHGHSDVKLVDALCRSCNVYFFAAARRMGPQPLVNWARQFGIGERTGIDLPSESPGKLPSPDDKSRQRAWKPGDTLQMAIGQSELEVTPLQIARMMAAIANDGFLVTPHLAASSGPATVNDSDSLNGSFPQTESRAIPGLHPETLDHIRHGLTMVVHDSAGTGYKKIRMKEVTIAGKTGTAQTGPGKVDHAWFAGYVPAERPRIAFVVVLQHAGSGGAVAGPVAKEFVKVLLDTDLISKTTEMVSERTRGPK